MDSVSAALRAVSIQDWSGNAALLSILVASLALFLVLRRVTSRRPRWQQVLTWASGCLVLLLYGSIALIFAVCDGGEIGESGKSRLARAYGDRVVQALARYQHDSSSYPANLTQLVPHYLSLDALRAPKASPLNYPFEYRRDSASYELSVQYSNPGTNWCSYTPEKNWSCGRAW